MFHRVSLHRFGVGRECDRISAVSEGLIRLTLVLAMQSLLRPATESCHQWSRSRAICTRGDNDLQCALPPALPGFRGTTNLSATPERPAYPSRASGWSCHL